MKNEFPFRNIDQVKKELSKLIDQRILELALTKKQVQLKLEIGQPRASQLINHKLQYFSIEALFKYAMILGVKFTINYKFGNK